MGIEDLPPEARSLIGQASVVDCPWCTPHPQVTPQLSGDTTRVWVPARIPNADRGSLVMVPSDGNGQIGALLESLQPPQHYSHMGIMTRDGTEVRQCTESGEWLRKHAVGTLGYPTDGFYEKAMRFGWPGTITQTVEAAWRSTRGDTAARTVSSRDGSVHATLPDLHVQGPVWAPFLYPGGDPNTQVPNDANVVSLEPFVLSNSASILSRSPCSTVCMPSR